MNTKLFSFYLIIFWIFLWVFPAPAQNKISSGDSLQIEMVSGDSLKLFSDEPVKSPRGAMLRSLVLPGWGQFYNESHLKAGLAFGTASFLVYHIGWYQYKWKEDKNPDFRNKRNLYSWYTALAYLITMADAYVDASLFKFDESMELSHRLDKVEGQWVLQAGLCYHF